MPSIDRFHDVSSQNKKRILDFENYNRINQRSDITIRNYSKLLCYYARHLGNKTFANATKKDVEDFFSNISYNANSQDTMKIGLRFFYRWLNDLEKGERLPECVRWLKTRGKKQIKRETNPKELKKRIITEDEYNVLLETSRGDLQTQAMVETLFWYGTRVSELLSMNVNSVTQNDIGVTIFVLESKTQPREATVLTKEHYPQALLNWIDNHPNRENPDKPLWFSTQSRTFQQRLSVSQAEKIINRLGERAKIRKHIKCHDFRHTAITRDCVNMAWTFVASKHGLEKNSCMQTVYDHNDHDKFLEHYRKQKDIIIEPSYNEIKKQKDTLEEQYNRRLKELEEKFNKLLDEQMLQGYQKIQQQWYEKQRLEEHEQDAELMQQYMRGEL
jgi:integrase/recombinase XerD